MLAQKYFKASPKHTQNVKKNKQKSSVLNTHQKKVCFVRRNSLTNFCTMRDNYQNLKGRVHIVLLKALCLFPTIAEQGRTFHDLYQGNKKQII